MRGRRTESRSRARGEKKRAKEKKNCTPVDVQRNKLDFLISCRNLLRFGIKHSLAWCICDARARARQHSSIRSWLLLSIELRFCGWNLLTWAYAFLFLRNSVRFFFSILYCFHGDECCNTATATLSKWCYSLCAQFTSSSSLSQLSKCSIHKHMHSKKKTTRILSSAVVEIQWEPHKCSLWYICTFNPKKKRRYLHINFWWSFLPMNRRLHHIGSMHVASNNFSPFLPISMSIKCR